MYMKKLIKLVQTVLCTACFCVLLVACSKITQQNFDQIKNNMTMKEVIALLGEPTSSESINIAGISGTSAVWKDENAEIDIQFLNDRVAVKAYSKLGNPEGSEQPVEQKQGKR